MTRGYPRGGKGDPYYGRPLRAFGLARHCAQCPGAEFAIRGEHHFLCSRPACFATKIATREPVGAGGTCPRLRTSAGRISLVDLLPGRAVAPWLWPATEL